MARTGIMNKLLRPASLEVYKKEAKKLFKSLPKNASLLQRILELYPYIPYHSGDISGRYSQIKLKHIYQVLAIEHGFENWASMRNYIIEQDMLYRKHGIAFIHSWFNNYLDAFQYFQKYGGYLLQFWQDYIVCGKEYLQVLGLDTFQSEWEKIGYNWVMPAHKEAYKRLYQAALLQYLQ